MSKIITKIKGTVRNYIWGKEQVTHTKVGWEDCRRKQKGDLGLVDLQHVTTCVFSKWIMYAIEPAASDLQILLRYRFAHFKPQPAGGGVTLDWFTLPKHQGFSRCMVLGHTRKT